MKGFLTEDGYGLIPYENIWMVIKNTYQLKVFWSPESGTEYIKELQGKIPQNLPADINKEILSSGSMVDTLKTAPKTNKRRKALVL